jgi:hypothetical protein
LKNTKVVVTLVALAIVAGAFFLLPASAHPYWDRNDTAEYVPPMWDEESYNGSYGPWHEPYPDCPMWDYDTESGEPEWNPPPWHDYEDHEEGEPGYHQGPGCGMMGQGSSGPMGGRGSRGGGMGYSHGGMMGGGRRG